MKKNRGSLTVEATLIVPVYIMVILTIVSFLNIFYTHAVMQHALNNTALRIAEYSYALKVSGSMDAFKWGEEAGANIGRFKSNVESVSRSAQKTMNSFSRGFSIQTLEEIINNANELKTNIDNLVEQMKSYDAQTLGKYAVGIFIDAGTDKLAEGIVKHYLKDMKFNLNNISNLDFSYSTFYAGDNDDIILAVTYEYHNPLGMKFFDKIKIYQQSVVHPWIGSGH